MYIMCIYRASADSAKIHSLSQNYRQVRIKYRTRNGMAKAGERCLARIFREISWWIRGIWWWFFKGAFLGEFMRFESRVFDEKINGNMDDLCFLSRSEVPSEIGRAAFSARWWQARAHVSCPRVEWMTALLRSPLVVGEVPAIDCSVVSQNRSWWLIKQTLPGFMDDFPNKLSIKTY